MTTPKYYRRADLDAAQQVLAEATRSRAEFPPFNSAHEGWAVLREEVDEMWDEVKANNLELALAEAVQVGAMAVRFIADLHERVGLDEPRDAIDTGADRRGYGVPGYDPHGGQ